MNKKAFTLLPLAIFLFLLGCSPRESTPTTNSSLYVEKEPDKTKFNVGEIFDVTGLKVVDAKSREEVKGYTLSIQEGHTFTIQDLSVKSVTVSKDGYKDDYFNIKVTNYKLMEIKSYPKIEYDINSAFDPTGLVVIDKTTQNPISNFSCSIMTGTVLSEYGYQTVTVSSSGYMPVTFDIHVSNFPQLEVTKMPDTVDFVIGDTFSLAGLEISSGGQLIEDYNVSCTLTEGQTIGAGGDYIVRILKDGYRSTSFVVSVYLEKIMTVDSLPNKINYETGETFNKEGLVIKDKDGTVLGGYTLSIHDGSILKNKGENTIIVKKEGYRDTQFKINVTQGSGSLSSSKKLNIYYLNDTHGSFSQLDGTYKEAGILNVSSYIKEQKQYDIDHDNYTLLLSGGDMFQGGLESNETHGRIMCDAMNIMGFDAMALGNHEFDWGDQYIYDFQTWLNCPILSCNTFYSNDKTVAPSFVDPYTVIQKGSLRIGVIGAAEQGMDSSMTGSIGNKFYFPNSVEYVQKASDDLRLSYNCDLVICVFHDGGYESGGTNPETEPTKFAALTAINSKTDKKYVDGMFFAHDHYQKRGVYNDVPYLEAGSNTKYVGRMTFNFNTDGVLYDINSYSTYNLSAYTNCTTPDLEVKALLTTYADQIGDPNEVLYDFQREEGYTRAEVVAISLEAMLWYVNNRFPAVFGNQHVYMSSHNSNGARAAISKGPLTRLIFVKVFPFDNKLCIQTCTSANIANLRNNSYYSTKSESNIIYDKDGLTKAVTISFVAEYKYAYNFQKSYVTYNPTAKMALELFLKEKVRTDL